MAESLASVYLDEDVSVVLAAILRARGFNTLTVRDAKQLGRSDAAQLTVASEANRVFLIHNRVDFEQLYREWLESGKPHAGIIIARRRLPIELATRVGRLLSRLSSEDLVNQLLYI